MRIAVLSDIHSNLVALDAVLAHAGRVDAVWHLGDVVGYGPDPDGVVARLAEIGAVGVRGNHDAAAVGGDEIEQFNPEARAAMEWTRADDLGTRPGRGWRRCPSGGPSPTSTLVHGSPRDPTWEYMTSPAAARASFGYLETTHGLNGHTHIPIAFVAAEDERDRGARARRRATRSSWTAGGRIANPGSVGQPRDGDPRASYLVLDPDAGTVTWHRVAYDIGAVQAAMAAGGLPPPPRQRLTHGSRAGR